MTRYAYLVIVERKTKRFDKKREIRQANDLFDSVEDAKEVKMIERNKIDLVESFVTEFSNNSIIKKAVK